MKIIESFKLIDINDNNLENEVYLIMPFYLIVFYFKKVMNWDFKPLESKGILCEKRENELIPSDYVYNKTTLNLKKPILYVKDIVQQNNKFYLKI